MWYNDHMGNYKGQRPTAEEQAIINAKISANRKGKGTGPRSPEVATVCPVCGKTFQQKKNLSTKKTYCSRQCANGTNTLKVTPAHKHYEENPKLCGCGRVIPYEYRNQRTHCSAECRALYGAPTKQIDPSNYVTFNCETCDKEVTRYKKYGNGSNRFCSNECSAKSNHMQHLSVDGVILDSGYEALVWGLTRLHKILIERFDRTNCIPVKDGWYGPDFIINGIPVEVKGYEDQDDRDRYKAWRDTGQLLSVIAKEDLDILRQCDRADFLIEIKFLTTHGDDY